MEVAKPAIFNGEAGRVGGVCNHMQVIFKDENERGDSRRTDAMGPFICTGRISGCMKREHYGGIRDRRDGVQDCGRIFNKFKEGIWRRRRGVSKSGGVKKAGARRKDDGGVCTGI